MSGGRSTKQLPEFVYFVGEGEWIQGPYVNPKKGRQNRKFKITEVPMDEPKTKKKKHEIK
jgi:hypothetical protein